MKPFIFRVFIVSLEDGLEKYLSGDHKFFCESGIRTTVWQEFMTHLKLLPFRSKYKIGCYVGMKMYNENMDMIAAKKYFIAVDKLLKPFNKPYKNLDGIRYYVDIWDDEYLMQNKEKFEEEDQEVQIVHESPQSAGL